MILQFIGTKEEFFVLSWIFITKTKTFQIALGFFKDKTKRLYSFKKIWKRNITKAFGPKILGTVRKRFVSIQNFELKTFTFDLFWNESSKTEASDLKRSLIWHCYYQAYAEHTLKNVKRTLIMRLIIFSVCSAFAKNTKWRISSANKNKNNFFRQSPSHLTIRVCFM